MNYICLKCMDKYLIKDRNMNNKDPEITSLSIGFGLCCFCKSLRGMFGVDNSDLRKIKLKLLEID